MNPERKRVTGILALGPRGPFVITDAGDHWVLDLDDFDPEMIGRQVTAEGVLVGYDRLQTDWMGEALH